MSISKLGKLAGGGFGVWMPPVAGILIASALFSLHALKVSELDRQIGKVSKSLSEAYRQAPDLLEAQKRFVQEEARFNAFREKLKSVDSGIPSEGELNSLLGGSWLGVSEGEILVSSPLELSREENFPYITKGLKVTIQGSYGTLVRYLEGIESWSGYLQVRSAKITRKDNPSKLSESLEIELSATYRVGASQETRIKSVPAAPKSQPDSSPFTLTKKVNRGIPGPSGELLLGSAVFRGRTGYVMVMGRAWREGDDLGGFTIQEISPERIVLLKGGAETVIAI